MKPVRLMLTLMLMMFGTGLLLPGLSFAQG